MIQGKYLNINDDLSDVLRIRGEVFEKGLEEEDKTSLNVIVYDGGAATGTGRIAPYNGGFIIDMVCVLKEYRGKGYGEFIIRLLADRALLAGAKSIHLNASEDTFRFFEKLFFTRDFPHSAGEGVGQVPMTLNLSDLKSPCGRVCSK